MLRVMQTPYLTLNGGKLVRVELRKPEIGERYASFTSEATFNHYLKRLNEKPSSYHYPMFRLCENESYQDNYYVTIVPV